LKGLKERSIRGGKENQVKFLTGVIFFIVRSYINAETEKCEFNCRKYYLRQLNSHFSVSALIYDFTMKKMTPPVIHICHKQIALLTGCLFFARSICRLYWRNTLKQTLFRVEVKTFLKHNLRLNKLPKLINSTSSSFIAKGYLTTNVEYPNKYLQCRRRIAVT
jgi:hypothetical protein